MKRPLRIISLLLLPLVLWQLGAGFRCMDMDMPDAKMMVEGPSSADSQDHACCSKRAEEESSSLRTGVSAEFAFSSATCSCLHNPLLYREVPVTTGSELAASLFHFPLRSVAFVLSADIFSVSSAHPPETPPDERLYRLFSVYLI